MHRIYLAIQSFWFFAQTSNQINIFCTVFFCLIFEMKNKTTNISYKSFEIIEIASGKSGERTIERSQQTMIVNN